MRKYHFVIACGILLVIAACKKGPGEGGSSHIKGKVLLLDYNGNYPVLDTMYYKSEEDIYIVYGEGSTYDERFRTSYDGSYEFKYLRKGTYKVFVYSDDSTGLSPSGRIEVLRTIEIDENRKTYMVPDLVIVKN